MTQTYFEFRFSSERFAKAAARVARGAGLAAFIAGAAAILGQNPAVPNSTAPAPATHFSTPEGYTAHHSVDIGGRINHVAGSKAMYDTLVNLQSGPRAMGETFVMHALHTNKSPLVDTMTAVGSGFGGDPYNFAKIDFFRGKEYEFSGIFRRDRQYFDYDLLANPNVIPGLSVPIGTSSSSTTSLPWPQVEQSPVLFNTVRRMTDTTFTYHPLSMFTYRVGYSQDIFQGPSLSPGASSNYFAETIGVGDMLLEEFQRNSADDFTGAIDWKPLPQTKITIEEEIEHLKADSYFVIAPQAFLVQEADGTPAAPGGWDSEPAYGLSNCNKSSMIDATAILSAPQTAGGKPIIDPACDVATSYMRSQPTRILFPTEILRIQSSSIPSVSMNGDFRYTNANMTMPNYYENFAGLDGAVRSITYTGAASAERHVVAADYGIEWQSTRTMSLADQVNFSNVHQPGVANISAGATLVTPTTAGSETTNYTGQLAAGKSATTEGSPNGMPSPAYFGQKLLTNDSTVSWDASPRTTLSLTYRYRQHVIAENEYSAAAGTAPVDPGGNPGNFPIPLGAATNGTVTIEENGGILSAAVRPATNWSISGSAELIYADNVFTPVGARQSQHYRAHTSYRPTTWATLSGAFNDYERHNNTNNNQASVAAGAPYEGPLNHVDRSREASINAMMIPDGRVSIDVNYAYSDVYTATNICFDNGATSTLPGTASTNAAGAANVCLGVYARGSTTQLADWHARDFVDAPTQAGAAEVTFAPTSKVMSAAGYRVTAVNGSQFFNDARSVNGSLNSFYDTPYLNVAWTEHPSLVWRAEYNYYGYSEGGASGPEYCSTSTTVTSIVAPCSSLPEPTGSTESQDGLTASRHYRANNVTVGIHYEF
jgi:hypothetical protein